MSRCTSVEGKAWEMKKRRARDGWRPCSCWRGEKPLDLDLKSRLGDLPKAALQDPRSLVWFDDWVLVGNGAARAGAPRPRDRGPSFFEADLKEVAVLQTQGILKDRLGLHFSMMRAVSFANQGG